MTDRAPANLTGLSDDNLAELERLLSEEGVDDETGGLTKRSSETPTPASFSQELLWMLDRATPGMTAYNLPIIRRIHGPLDIGALQQALNAVAARHEALRTRFADGETFPVQLVDAASPVPLSIEEIAAGELADADAAVERLVIARIRTPFDLAHEPAFRAQIIRIDATHHVLVLETHHIVVDGWSLGIIFRELGQTYIAAKSGQPGKLADVPFQFGDYAAWQRERLAGPRLQELLAFWKQQLGEATEPLGLSTDKPRTGIPTFAGGRERITLGQSQLGALRQLAARHDATLYMVLLAAYGTVFHRYTGRTEVLIGSGSAGRSMPEMENVVGYVNNTLVQRATFTPSSTFADVLRGVRRTALDAYDHQDIPLEKLVLELRKGEARQAPLFEVVLTMQETLGESLTLGDLTVEPFGVDFGATKFDITLLVTERNDELILVAQYRSDLFARESMQRFLGHVTRVLDAAVRNPGVHISDIAMLSHAERAELSTFNATNADEGPVATLVQLFEAQAARVPSELAVIAGNTTLTYDQLNAHANQLARQLQSLGVSANTPVGLLLDRTAHAIVGLLGILKAGGAYVPLSIEAPDARLAAQINECGARVVVSDVAHAPKLSGGVNSIVLDNPDTQAALAALSSGNLNAAVSADDLAYVLYTSGSTGTPKGVAISHRNAVHYARAVSRVLADVPPSNAGDGFAALDGKQFAIASTLAADLGNTSLLPSLLSGGTLHVLARETTTDAANYGEYARAHRLDILKITPNHLAALIAGKSGADLAAILPRMWLVVGGEALRPEVARVVLGANSCRLLNHYGPTETTVGVCTFEVTAESMERALRFGAQSMPLGRPLVNTHAYIVDSSHNEMPLGIPGELLLGGAGVATGYFHRDDLTAERFVNYAGERVYRTGDRVRRLPDGTLEFLGRADDQVKIRGHRVELGEVEHALRAHPGVAAAVVIMREDATGQPSLAGFAVARTGDYAVSHSDRPTPERLSEWLASRLPAHMIPGTIMLLDAIPLTANGKVDKARLPATTAVAELQYVAPRTDTETQLVAIWSEVLKQENIGITDNFLSLGGHSLMAIRVLGKISKAFGVRLPLRILFETPTIEGLAQVIEKERAVSKPASSGIGASSRDKYKIGATAPSGGASSGDAS